MTTPDVRADGLPYRAVRRMLFALPAERVHTWVFGLLRAVTAPRPLRKLLTRWLAPADDALLSQHALETPMQLMLALEDREVELAQSFDTLSEVEEPEPQVVVFASGEVTPFVAGFYRELTGGRFRVDVEFDGTVEVSQDGFE